jgi:hypothetical protein
MVFLINLLDSCFLLGFYPLMGGAHIPKMLGIHQISAAGFGSPAGWGYIAENDSDSEEEEAGTPPMLHVWHSPQPDRQMLTGRGPICPPDPPPAQQSLSDSSQPPRPKTASLHQVIQALHERAAQPSPSVATPCKRRQYGSAAFSYQQTSDGMIRCEMTTQSKKRLARRGGHWDVVGEDVYLDSDQSDREENEGDEDENNLEELRDHLWNISFSM